MLEKRETVILNNCFASLIFQAKMAELKNNSLTFVLKKLKSYNLTKHKPRWHLHQHTTFFKRSITL